MKLILNLACFSLFIILCIKVFSFYNSINNNTISHSNTINQLKNSLNVKNQKFLTKRLKSNL